jgi:hypothetical protein
MVVDRGEVDPAAGQRLLGAGPAVPGEDMPEVHLCRRDPGSGVAVDEQRQERGHRV